MTSFHEVNLIAPAETTLQPVSVSAVVLFLLFIVVVALARVREPASEFSSKTCWTCCQRNRNQSRTDDDVMCTDTAVESVSVVGGASRDRGRHNLAVDSYGDNFITLPSEQMKSDQNIHKQSK